MRNFVVVFALGLLATSGCHERRISDDQEQIVSYAPRSPGSVAAPTHETSFRLIAVDGPTRFESFRLLFKDAAKRCALVTSAILQGGLDGTDEWRVKCTDSGVWTIWFRPGAVVEILPEQDSLPNGHTQN